MADLTTLEPVLFIPDPHIPYHDPRAWDILLKAGKLLKPKHLVIIGDFLDSYAISAHSKDPARKGTFKEEIAAGNKELDALDSLGATNKLYIEGNHEDRMKRYIADRAPELHGVVTIPKLLHLKERGWKFTEYRRHTKLGRINLTHDVEATGRNAVFRAMDMFQHSVVTGHTHRLQYIVEGNATGEVKLSAMFGWLGDAKRVDYMHAMAVAKNWTLGFGFGYLDRTSGIVYVTPVPIIQHTCVVNGKLLRG